MAKCVPANSRKWYTVTPDSIRNQWLKGEERRINEAKFARDLKTFNREFQTRFNRQCEVYRFVSMPHAVYDLLGRRKLRTKWKGWDYVSLTLNPKLYYGAIRMEFDSRCLKDHGAFNLTYTDPRKDYAPLEWNVNRLDPMVATEEEVRLFQDAPVAHCLKKVTVQIPPDIPNSRKNKERADRAKRQARELKKRLSVPVIVE